jgi:hypothetical protein
MRELDKISESLFNKIRAQFDHVSLGDKSSKSTTDPEQARFFNFDYIGKSGQNFGNVTVSLVDEGTLKVYFSANIAVGLEPEDEKEWYGFLKNLRHFARRNMLQFDVRDINRSNLDLKDIKQQSQSDSTFDKEELAIAESKLYGLGNNRRVSFADIGPHKLIIKHKDQIDPERHGARARQIEHIFIETPIGERFLLDHTNLHGARATANHLRHGGNIGDEGSNLINEMVKEMASMRHFVRSMRNRTFEDAETVGMVEAALARYNEVKDHLKRFQGRKGHELLQDMCQQKYDEDTELDVDALRERFVKKIYDDRFNEALPYVYRAYKHRQKINPPGSHEFESWANDVVESTWDDDGYVDNTEYAEFIEIMQSPLSVGLDGVDAIAALSDIIDTETLSIAIRRLSVNQGPDADARRTVAGWLAANGGEELANQIIQLMQQENASTEQQPVSPETKKQNTGASSMDEPVVSEEILSITRLAGL